MSKKACPTSVADCLLSRGGSKNLSSDAKIFIISYHLMAGANKEKFQLRPDGKPHQMIIADESHCIKDKHVEIFSVPARGGCNPLAKM